MKLKYFTLTVPLTARSAHRKHSLSY